MSNKKSTKKNKKSFSDTEAQKLVSRYPAHALEYPRDIWVDPLTDLAVPKKLVENIKYREQVVKDSAQSVEVQSALMAACSVSPLFWMNTFAFTYRPKYTCPDGVERSAGAKYKFGVREYEVPSADAPIITWPAQDEMVNKMQHTFAQGGTMLIDKSREQGATVICMYMLQWAWLFLPRFSALVISRKADMVDGPTEDSLLGKLDYVSKGMPSWMLNMSHVTRRRGNNPAIINEKMNTRIIGETSNKDVGQSLRTTVTFVDEAARFPNGKALLKSITSVSSAYILASTPDGPGTEFSKLCEHAATEEGSQRLTVCTLGYWDHPEMGLGREPVQDKTGEITGKTGAWYWETPAFSVKRDSTVSKRDLRENWLIDHDTSGLLVLDSNALSKMRRMTQEPFRRCRVVFPDGNANDFELIDDPEGELSMWVDLDQNGKASLEDNYIQSWDFSQGVEGSNTIGAILSRETGDIVAEWASPSIPPHECARYAAVLGEIFGGAMNHAFCIWERNGPGMSFGYEMAQKFNYPHLYYQRIEDTRTEKKTRRWGWQSTNNSREILFDQLNKALVTSSFFTPNEEGVSDMAQWIYDEYGRIICGARRDETTGAQARHGDRAIAYALAVKAREEVMEFIKEERKYEATTFGYIAKHAEKMAAAVVSGPAYKDPFGKF